MVKLLRRFKHPLTLAMTLLTSISFVWFYNRNDYMDRGAPNLIGSVYGKKFPQAQFLREGRKFDLAQGLTPELWQTLIQPAQTQDEATNNFVWNAVILRHEADALGIRPTDKEIEEGIKTLPFFQTNGVYDSTKYNNLIGVLSSRGLTSEALEELVGDQARLKRIKALLGTTVVAMPGEVRAMYELRHGKFECSVVRFAFDEFLKAQQVSDEDVKKAYEERKSTLKTEELRKVKYVGFTVENAEKPLVGKERVDAFAKLSEKAQEFMIALADPKAKFEEVAAKLGAEIKETPAFSEDEPPAELDKSSKAAAAAFKLTKDQPASDAVQTEKGYFLLLLSDVTLPREKTLDEAKTALIDSLKAERAQEAMTLKATEVRNKIEAELKAGKTFADAATAAGMKAEVFAPFSLSEPPFKEKDGREVTLAARDLQPGQLSPFSPTMGNGMTPGGGVLVFLDKKQPIDEKAFEESKAQTLTELTERDEEGLFRHWFKARRAAAKVLLARDEKKAS